jgi:hypothetical protein
MRSIVVAVREFGEYAVEVRGGGLEAALVPDGGGESFTVDAEVAVCAVAHFLPQRTPGTPADAETATRPLSVAQTAARTVSVAETTDADRSSASEFAAEQSRSGDASQDSETQAVSESAQQSVEAADAGISRGVLVATIVAGSVGVAFGVGLVVFCMCRRARRNRRMHEGDDYASPNILYAEIFDWNDLAVGKN